MTNIILHPDEKGISVAVRAVKSSFDDNYFYAIEITVNDTLVIIYSNEIKNIVKMTNDIDRNIMKIIDHK